jgi:hypothetical protein
MRWPFNPNLDRITCGAAKSREPHHDLTEKRGDRTLPVILHVTNASAAPTIRPKNGVGPGLSGHDFLLENRKHLLRFGQSQTQGRDVAKVFWCTCRTEHAITRSPIFYAMRRMRRAEFGRAAASIWFSTTTPMAASV